MQMARQMLEEAKKAFSSRDKVKWEDLPPVLRAYLKSLGYQKPEPKKDEVLRVIEDDIDRNEWTGLPPCIKRAASLRDTEALDEIFAYFHTFGTDKMDPVLWTIGYYTLDNYEQRKLTAEAQVKTAPRFPCTPFDKPPHLSKYCPGDCPLRRDHYLRLSLLIDRIEVVFFRLKRYANITIVLKDGTVYRFDRHHATPRTLNVAVRHVFEDFLDWYFEKYNDFFRLGNDEIERFIAEKMRVEVVANG